MYSRSNSHVHGYDKAGKSIMHAHVPVTHRHVSSQNKDKDSRKPDSVQRQRSNDKNMLQKHGVANHISKSSHDRTKHHKVQGALRSCGNWSEHVSSSGKIYFYNNISEVSQWEKPKEWNDSTAVDLKTKEKTKAAYQRSNSKSSRSSQQGTSKSQATSNTSSEIDKDYRSRNKDYLDRDYRTKPTSSDRDYRDIDYRDVSSSRSADTKDNSRRTISTDKDYRSLNSSSNSRTVTNHTTTNTGSNGHNLLKQDSYVPSTGEFYDYSTWNENKKSTETNTVNGTPPHTRDNTQHPVGGVSSSGDHANISDNKNTDSATSEFVKKLSSVLTQAASTSNNHLNKSEGNLKNVFQLLLNAAANSQVDKAPLDACDETTKEITSSDEPPAKRLCQEEPETEKQPSMEIDQSIQSTSDISTSVLEFVSLEALCGVFEPTAILHIQNWQAEQHEKECQRLSDDFHRLIGDHMSELSVQLTNARSQVRASEILSTIQEQRVLYIRQQIKDLERSTNASAHLT